MIDVEILKFNMQANKQKIVEAMSRSGNPVKTMIDMLNYVCGEQVGFYDEELR
jgi:hypothetical protein